MAVTQDLTYVSTGLSRLLQQFKGKPKIEGFLTALLRQVQTAEDATWDLFALTVDTAVGVQLDDIYGAIVGLERLGLSDDAYRVAIKAQIKANISSGTGDDLLDIARLMLSGAGLTLTEGYPCAVEIVIDTIAVTEDTTVFAALSKAKASGVGLWMVYSDYAAASTAIFDSSTTTQRWDDASSYMGVVLYG